MQALLICETRLFWMLLNEAGSRGICKLGCNCSEVVITTHLNFASCLVRRDFLRSFVYVSYSKLYQYLTLMLRFRLPICKSSRNYPSFSLFICDLCQNK